MPTLTKQPILIVALVLVIPAASCSRERSVIYQVQAPDGSAIAQLVTFLSLPSGKDVAQWQLSSGGGTTVIQTWTTSDMNPCFIAAAWAPDSQAIIGLYRDCWHGSELTAFDVKARKRVDPGKMTKLLAAKIRSDYAVPASIADPIAWARQTKEAKDAFARTSYR